MNGFGAFFCERHLYKGFPETKTGRLLSFVRCPEKNAHRFFFWNAEGFCFFWNPLYPQQMNFRLLTNTSECVATVDQAHSSLHSMTSQLTTKQCRPGDDHSRTARGGSGLGGTRSRLLNTDNPPNLTTLYPLPLALDAPEVTSR